MHLKAHSLVLSSSKLPMEQVLPTTVITLQQLQQLILTLFKFHLMQMEKSTLLVQLRF